MIIDDETEMARGFKKTQKTLLMIILFRSSVFIRNCWYVYSFFRACVRVFAFAFVRSCLSLAMWLFVNSFVRSFMRVFVHAFIHWFLRGRARARECMCVRACVRVCVRSFVRSFVPSAQVIFRHSQVKRYIVRPWCCRWFLPPRIYQTVIATCPCDQIWHQAVFWGNSSQTAEGPKY